MGPQSRPELRASDSDREAAVGRLRIAAMEGRLDADELATRVTAAYRATWCGELDRLTADVTPVAPVAIAGPPSFVQPGRGTNGFAIASLVLGAIWFMWLGSIAAVVCGHIALRQIRDSHGRQGGKGLAVSGLALGYLGVLMLTAVIVSSIASA